MIITLAMIRKAIELTRPTAEAILATNEAVWGPRWVEGQIEGPDLPPMYFIFAQKVKWNPEWGVVRNFLTVAEHKFDLAKHEKANTSITVATKPWLIKDDEYLYAGGAHKDGITAAASGAKGRADENISQILIDNLIMLAFLETDRRIENHQMRI